MEVEYGKRRMATMPGLQKQNSDTDKTGHNADEFPAVLPQV